MSLQTLPPEATLEGLHCTLRIHRPCEGVVVARYSGPDIGELGEAPFHELEKDLAPGLPIELYVDARDVLGATVDVSELWARWMRKHRTQVHRMHMLVSTRLLEVTAGFVRSFTGYGDRMRIYTEPERFDAALLAAVGR